MRQALAFGAGHRHQSGMENAHVPLPAFAIEDGTPVSGAFGDVYFSRAGGPAETEHVFLTGNRLPARFAEKAHFTIAETGFGTGLNFLVAWQSFLKHAPAHHHLHYLSVEKFPLTPPMLAEALSACPDLSGLAEALIAAYPLRLPGLHRIHLPRVTLTLAFGDAASMLSAFDTPVDAWFLDGFSPSKNPDLWSEAVFSHIGRLSAPDATLATFTSAGFVRRGLQAQGFAIEKVAGHGHKREMSIGQRRGTESLSPQHSQWHQAQANRDVLIIGGGIAGCTLARALAERGATVTLLDAGTVAGGASGNPAGVLFPQLTKRWTPAAAWHFAAYSFALHQLARWEKDGLSFTYGSPGMLRLPRHDDEEAQLRTLGGMLGLDPAIAHWISREEASALAGTELPRGGAWFPQGTWLSPATLCRALIQHPRITVIQNCEITALAEEAQWVASSTDGRRFAATYCCITSAQHSAAIYPSAALTINRVAGQLTHIAAADVRAPVRTILCQKGYVIPLADSYLIGATYNHDGSLAVTDANHAQNIAETGSILPDWIHGKPFDGRTALRATTPDRLPYVGALAPNLFISAGFGSRGLLSAPLAAEILASEITGESSPVAPALREALKPSRFTR